MRRWLGMTRVSGRDHANSCAGGFRCPDAGRSIFEYQAIAGTDTQAARCQYIALRRRFACRDILGGNQHVREGKPGSLHASPG